MLLEFNGLWKEQDIQKYNIQKYLLPRGKQYPQIKDDILLFSAGEGLGDRSAVQILVDLIKMFDIIFTGHKVICCLY